MSPLCRRRLSIALLAVSLGSGLAADASADGDSDRALGIGLAREGRCESALETLTRVQLSFPDDAEVARLRGECAIRLQDFRIAIDALELARSLDPESLEVDLRLGMAYYHAGRVDEARAALIRAGSLAESKPEFLLYSGLVAYAQADYPRALGRLDAATQMSDAAVEPMASFYMGRAALGLDNRDRAVASFRRVVSEFPGTSWSEEAQRLLDAIESRKGVQWWASAELGVQFDDNALLLGRGVGLPSEISGQSDQRGFWFIDVGAEFIEFAGFRGGATLRYGGSENAEFERFDTHAPGATVWVDRELGVGDSSLRLQYDFDAALIDYGGADDEPFVISNLVAASIYKPWNNGMYTIVETSVGRDHYGYDRSDFLPSAGGDGSPANRCLDDGVEFCGPANLNEANATNRDGTGTSASLLHHVPLSIEIAGLTSPWIEAEYRYQRYWSEGSEYDHQRHQVEIGFGVVLPFEIGLRVIGRYAYVPYANASVFPDPSDVALASIATTVPPNPSSTGNEYFLDPREREEHETGIRVSLTRAFGQHVVLTTRYSRTRNRSTADVFSYSRDLFGVSIRVGLGG